MRNLLQKKALKLWKLVLPSRNGAKTKAARLQIQLRETYQSLIYVGFIAYFMLNCLLFRFHTVQYSSAAVDIS